MRDFKRIRVWRQAHDLTLAVYRATASFPGYELFGLTSQIRRAASSVPMNIAEGCGYSSNRQFAHYLETAAASTNEVEYALILSRALDYLDRREHRDLHLRTSEVRRMLVKLRYSLT